MSDGQRQPIIGKQVLVADVLEVVVDDVEVELAVEVAVDGDVVVDVE